MKVLFQLSLFFVATFYFNTTKANNIDSLLKVLKSAKEDSNKVKTLYQIGFLYGIEKSDSAIYSYEQAKSISKKINYTKGEIKYYIEITGLYNDMGKYDTALLLNFESVAIAEKFGDKKLLANCIANVANSFLNLKKLDSASVYYFKAETILNNNNDKYGLLVLYGNLCALYASLGQYEKAINYASKVVVLHKEGIGNDNDFLYVLTNLGATYLNLNKNDSCIFYSNQALLLGKKVENYPVLLINFQNLIYAKVNEGEFLSLLPLAKQIEALGDKMKTAKFEAKLNMNYAIAYYYNGKTKLAEAYALKAYKISEENKLPSITQSVCVILTKIESTLGNFKLANTFDAKRDSIYDAELNEEVASNVQDVEKKYETQKKENEIIKLNSDNKEKSTLNKIFIGSTAGLSLLGFLGFRNFKGRQKLQQQKITELEKDKQLSAIDAMLQGQEEERSRIAKDLHDGLGGMLSGTKLSFIHTKENLVLTPENATQFDKSLSMLDNTIADLRKVAHNLMPEALIKFGLQEAVRDFCNSIQSSTNVKVVCQPLGVQNKLSNTAEVFTYRIIQELVNNAVKHANATQIIVQLTTNNNKVGIAVEDDGKGFDVNALANSKGAGMDNIKYRVQYFNGTIDTVTSAGNGTSVNIELVV